MENAYLRAKSTEREAGIRMQIDKVLLALLFFVHFVSEAKHTDDFCYIG